MRGDWKGPYQSTLHDKSDTRPLHSPTLTNEPSTASQAPKWPQHRTKTFVWKRGTYQIFIRSAGVDAPWYFQFRSHGARHKQSLSTTDPLVATERARLLLEADEKNLTARMRAVLDGADVTAVTRSADFSRINDVLAWLDKRPRPVTRDVDMLHLVLRKLFATPELLTTEVLAPDLARRWKLMHEEKCTGKTQDEANRIMRSANSVLHQAKTVFSAERLADMKLAGFTFPDMQLFFNEVKARRFKRLPKKTFVPVAPSLIARALREWRTLPRNEFLAVGLMLACGLRKSEVAQVQGHWFTSEEGRPVLTGIADVKNRKGRVHVFPINPFWKFLVRRMKAEGWTVRDGEYLLAGSMTERCEKTFKRIAKWLRGMGWQMQKTNHAFRDYAGSQVAMKYGLDAAKEFLNHASVTTTEAHYSSFVKSHATRGHSYIKWA